MNDAHILDGQNGVVVGGAGRIGSAVGRGFMKHGASVMLVDRREDELGRAAATCDEIKPGSCSTLAVDLKSYEDCQKLAADIERSTGPVDILVNCLGGIYRAPFLEHSIEELDVLLNVNVRLVFMLCQAFGKNMADRGRGKIINIASVGGVYPEAEHSGYCAAKAALVAFSKVAALELADNNVQVNLIAPGPTETIPFTSAFYTEHPDVLRRVESQTPAGRIGHPEDHVGLAVFLASNASNWITGQIIMSDGGLSLA